MSEYLERADEDLRARRYREAADGYAKAAEVEPGDVKAYAGLARCWANLKRYDEAIGACNRGLALDPGNATLHAVLGYVYLMSGKLRESEAEYRTALLVDPQSVPARYGLTHVLMRQKRHLEAEEPLRPLLEAEPDNVTALQVMRWVYLHQPSLGEARALSRRVHRLRPGPGSLFDYLDTWVLGWELRFRALTLILWFGLIFASLLLSPLASLIIFSLVLVFFIWVAVRNFRSGDRRRMALSLGGCLLAVAAYLLQHAR